LENWNGERLFGVNESDQRHRQSDVVSQSTTPLQIFWGQFMGSENSEDFTDMGEESMANTRASTPKRR
jgi:hypothetical protein